MTPYSKEKIEAAVKAKGYIWFDSASDYDVNIVGVRNSAVGQVVTNSFDDALTISYKVNGIWQFKQWSATTDPGTKGVKEFHNPNGVARLAPGQYRGSHCIGLHQGKYEALCQHSQLTVFRDANRDMIFEETKTDAGIFGINIHHAGADSTLVENWSEGCQVFKRIMDFNEFMVICHKAKDLHGNSFTYTLLESKNII